RGVQHGAAPARARAGRLQPERVGPDARLGLLGAPDAARRRLDPGHLGRGRAWDRDRRLPHRQRARARQATWGPVGAAAREAPPSRPGAIRVISPRRLLSRAYTGIEKV